MDNTMIHSIQSYSIPYKQEKDLDSIVQAIGDAKIVLLGEASHGTSEFYTVRAELSKRLIEEKGFTIITVEGDWPASQAVNSYIKGYDHQTSSKEVLESYKRWPTWMWANEEIVEFITWLKQFNEGMSSSSEQVGFYGLDVYSLWESMEEVLHYLKETNSPELELAQKAFSCFEPFGEDSQQYAISAGLLSDDCTKEVVNLLTSIRKKKHEYEHFEEELSLNLEMNALVLKNAEHYYKTMVVDDHGSWNIRDEHMVEVLQSVMNYYGEKAKVIVWEHNTHVGDARATDMAEEGMVNVGQLVREQHNEEDVYIVGFGTNRGRVIASSGWGQNIEEMVVPKAVKGSWEHLLHQAGPYNQILLFDDENRALFNNTIGHRAIGVVYNPRYEQYGNYVPTKVSERYDAFIYIEETTALKPLQLREVLL